MLDYMAELKRTQGFESPKSQYLKQYPSLQAENMSNMEDRLPGEDDDEDIELVPTNPIERRDARIAELEKAVSDLSSV